MSYGNGECECCGHFIADGIGLREGIRSVCIEAYPEDYGDLDDNAADCPKCQGTGIGQHGDPDTSKCSACGGRGYAIAKPERDVDAERDCLIEARMLRDEESEHHEGANHE